MNNCEDIRTIYKFVLVKNDTMQSAGPYGRMEYFLNKKAYPIINNSLLFAHLNVDASLLQQQLDLLLFSYSKDYSIDLYQGVGKYFGIPTSYIDFNTFHVFYGPPYQKKREDYANAALKWFWDNCRQKIKSSTNKELENEFEKQNFGGLKLLNFHQSGNFLKKKNLYCFEWIELQSKLDFYGFSTTGICTESNIDVSNISPNSHRQVALIDALRYLKR